MEKLKDLQEANTVIKNRIKEGHDTSEINELYSPIKTSKASARSINESVEKVLIFSQFLEHIHVIEQQVILNFIEAQSAQAF